MMNFIPSKIGHEELEYQNSRSGIQSQTDFISQQLSSIQLNNIKGDEDSNDGHVSDDDVEQYNIQQHNQDYFNQQYDYQINNQHNIQAGIQQQQQQQHGYSLQDEYRYDHKNNNNRNNKQQTYSYGQKNNLNQIVSPRTASQKNNYHTQSLSMKENYPSKNYQNQKQQSTSPYPQKNQLNTKNQQQYQGNHNNNNNNSSNNNMKSFEKSYQELTQQILSQRYENQDQEYVLKPQDLLLGQQQLQEFQKRKQYDSKTQNDLFKRLNKEALLQQENKQLLTLEQQRKEMESCTFTPQIINKANVDDQRTLTQFLSDQNKFQKNQNEKINMLRLQIEEENTQNTTYQPKINSKSEMIVQMKRTEKEPAHDRLYKIAKEKNDRKEDVRQSNQSNLFNGTNRFSSRTSNQFQTHQLTEYELQLEQQNTFQPQINQKSKIMLRKGKVGDHLYQDALRRQEKVQSQQESIMLKQKSTMSTQTKIVSNKTEQIVAIKFVREFENVCDEILHDPNAQKIDYLQMGEILSRLSFLKINGNTDNENLSNMGQERKLVYDIWNNLRGDELGGVTKCNLCQFLLIVVGIFGFQLQTEEQIRQQEQFQIENNLYTHNPNNQMNQYNGNNKNIAHATLYLQERYTEEEDEDNYDDDNYNMKQNNLRNQQQLEQFNQENYSFQNKLQQFNSTQKLRKGFIDQIGNWNISADDAKLLQKEFDMLYRNRLSNEELKKTEYKPQNTFQPQILPQSKRLAENYREKLLEETANLIQNQELQVKVPASGKITHVDLLVFQKQAQMKEREKKNMHQSITVQQSCTFHPQTLSNSCSNAIISKGIHDKSNQSFNNTSQTNPIGGIKKSNQLYNLSKLKGQKKDKDRNDIEYEKNFDECTFQPDIAITRSKSSNALRKTHQSNSTSQSGLPGGKDTDKAIERMRAANKMREDKNLMLSRGYNKPNKNNQDDKKRNVPVSSRLYNDVPLYRQSKQNDTSNQQEMSEQQIDEQNEYTQNRISQQQQSQQDQGMYQQDDYRMNQQQIQQGEQGYRDNQMNQYQNGYNNGINSYNQQEDEGTSDHDQFMDKQSSNSNLGSFQQYNQIQPINPLEKVPLLFVDVNLGTEKTERIIVFEGDTSEQLAAEFSQKNNLDSTMRQRLKELLDFQIAGLLTKIDEEEAPSMMSD